MRFAGEVDAGRPDVKIYRFEGSSKRERVYAVWCPTSEDKHIANYRFPTKVTAATSIAFLNGKTQGIEATLSPKQGAITLPISETPVLLRVTEAER